MIVRGVDVGDPGVPVGVFSPGNDSGADRFRLRSPGPVPCGPPVLGPGVLGAALFGEAVGDVVSLAAATFRSSTLFVSC